MHSTEQASFGTNRSTLQRIASVAGGELGVWPNFPPFSRILSPHGWTPQWPAAQAREGDEEVVRKWLTRRWAAAKNQLYTTAASFPFWTKRVTNFGRASGPRGRRKAT
ncbi:MAG: winged helix-turn-helix domain-containing protein [Gemmatimonadaceae bacterium]|jgi:hypothetical protein|nr:winged helix-turn-helix domain-containing protein [Gemmatimonadaceae bacterium]